MSLTVILSFVVTTIISALMIPLVIKAGNQLGIVAHINACFCTSLFSFNVT